MSKIMREVSKYSSGTFSGTNITRERDMYISILSDSNIDVTNINKINLVSGCEEALKCKVFEMNKNNYSKRVLSYKKSDVYYEKRDFDRLTNNYGHRKVFRRYLCEYINQFQPVVLSMEKDLKIKIRNTGEFYVTKGDTEGYLLTSCENTLFEFFCYIELNKFWDGFAELCSLNVPKLPLLLVDFLEKTDSNLEQSMDFIRNNIESDRQIIIVSNK